MDGLRYSPDDPYYRLGPVYTCLYVRARETGDWDLFLVPLEWAKAETGGADLSFFSFLLYFRRPNLITGLSG